MVNKTIYFYLKKKKDLTVAHPENTQKKQFIGSKEKTKIKIIFIKNTFQTNIFFFHVRTLSEEPKHSKDMEG